MLIIVFKGKEVKFFPKESDENKSIFDFLNKEMPRWFQHFMDAFTLTGKTHLLPFHSENA